VHSSRSSPARRFPTPSPFAAAPPSRTFTSPPAARYSEDIDQVQTESGGIGEVLDAIHAALDPRLGEPKWKQSEGRVTLNYRFASEDVPSSGLKLKIEINSREHFTVLGHRKHLFEVASRWFNCAAHLRTYALDELLGTKLRALYQRKKGRDLFDLSLALKRDDVQPERVVDVFARYMEADGAKVTRAMFEQNLAAKRKDPIFTADMRPLLAHGHTWDFDDAFELVWTQLAARLPGAPWKGG
jgi:predicted nucleotidyltransferase component of viral defense system